VPCNSSSSQTDIPGETDSDESMSDYDAQQDDSEGIVQRENASMARATADSHPPSMLTEGARADEMPIFSQTTEETTDYHDDQDDEHLKCKMEREEPLAKFNAAHGLQTITEHSRHRVAKTLLEVRDKIHDLYKDADSDMQLRLAEIGQHLERSLYLEDLRVHGEMAELG
jgi:hypothetical protein